MYNLDGCLSAAGVIHITHGRWSRSVMYDIKKGNLPLSAVESFAYNGKDLQKVTQFVMEHLKPYGLNVNLTESNFGDIEIKTKSLPYLNTVAKFTDGKWVIGRVDVRVTGPHNDGTCTPLVDLVLEGTERCEKEKFGKYNGLPDYNDFRRIVEEVQQLVK